MTLDGFQRFELEHGGMRRRIYRSGEGPAVIVIHEVPGITPDVERFARLVADDGFTVMLPHLFGTPGKPYGDLYAVGQIVRACIAREFHVLAAGHASPITEWLRALCRHAHREIGGPGVGVVGMCLTGNFALALMADASVMAPVLSQPSLPFPFGARRKRALHVSNEALEAARRRADHENLRLLGLRFSHDWMCPPERFARLREVFGARFEAVEIDSGPDNAHGIPRTAHSVLSRDLVDRDGHPTRAALARVLALFHDTLDG